MVREYFREADVQVILKMKLPTRQLDDFIAWHYERSGVFSVRSAYKLAKDLADEARGTCQPDSRNQADKPIWKSYLKLPIPHKVLIFGWKVIKNGLATQASKKQRTIVVDSTCTICDREKESTMHALLWCDHTVSLREAMRQFWPLPDEQQLRSLSSYSLLHHLTSVGTDEAARLLLLLWRTWHVRNCITHDSEKLSFEGSVKFLRKHWTELCDIRQQGGRTDPHGKLPTSDSLVTE
jgi:hypothetical protein